MSEERAVTNESVPGRPSIRSGTEANRAHERKPINRAHDRAPINRNVVLAVLVSGAFVIILNQTLLNTALPAFMEDFGISASAAQWVTTIFMLVNGIMIPVTAFLIQRFTTRALFLTAMGLFIIGTVVCALAPVYPVLLAGVSWLVRGWVACSQVSGLRVMAGCIT